MCSYCGYEWIQIIKTRNNEVSARKKYTTQVAETCQDRDLSEDSMVIGTSAIVDTELDGAVGMNEVFSLNCKNNMQLNITNFIKRRKDKLVENVYDSFMIEI